MRRERGVAVITAILIVAVAASAAAMMLSQQSAMIDQALMVSSRAQADLYAQAGVDWARGVLAEDARRTRDVDTLAEGWAQPIAALPVDRALVAGSIADEQGRFNLNNVMNGNQPSAADIRMLREILGHVGLAPDLADAVVDWIDAAPDLSGSGGAEDAFYLALQRPYRAANRPMVQLEELYRVRGFDAAAVAKLRPWVTALPIRTATNVNTAGDVVIAALLGVARDKAAGLVAERRAKPFQQKADFAARVASLGAAAAIPDYGVSSMHFLVHVRVAQDDVQLATEALVRRVEGGATDIIWRRPRY